MCVMTLAGLAGFRCCDINSEGKDRWKLTGFILIGESICQGGEERVRKVRDMFLIP